MSVTDGASRIVSAGLAAHPSGWFTGGRLLWASGANAGRAVAVGAHRRAGDAAELDLWQPAARPIVVGDAFALSAGCDKRLATCAAKFANVANHRGFPHLPGNAYVARVARPGEPGLDGGSLFR